MHPFEIMAEPVRRSIVELLASGEHFSGEIEAAVGHEFGVSRSAVQRHLAILRAHGWVVVREDWNQRGYRLDDGVVDELRREVRRVSKRWKRRTGWVGGVDPLAHSAPGTPKPGSPTTGTLTPGTAAPGTAAPGTARPASRRGRRGGGFDPHDPWRG